MATATTESEDLLILPQEDTDTLVMDKEATNDEIIAPTNNSISFDENEITLDDNSLEESTLEITEDKEVKKEENTSDSLEITEDKEVKKEENTSDSLEITEDIDLGDLSIEDSVEEKNEENISDTLEITEDVDLGNLSTPEASNDSVGTMEDILARAIADLDSRSEIIGNDKKTEEDKKSDFKGQIKDLQGQIKDIQTKIDDSDEKISELNSELAMIAKNNKSLENMKKINPTKDISRSTSKKVHNAKRKAA